MATSKKYSMVKVFGLPHLHENASIKFIPSGIALSVGLNVTKKIAFILTHNNFEGKVFKGEYMQVYKLASKLQSHRINDVSILKEHARLLDLVQQDIRVAKLGLFLPLVTPIPDCELSSHEVSEHLELT